MGTPKLGVAVLIVNKDFEDKSLDLPQLEKDQEVVKETFGAIGFEIKEIIDKKREQIIKEVEDIRNNDVHDNDKCFVCIVCSHGFEHKEDQKLPEDAVFAWEQNTFISLRDITSLFTNGKCTKLKDKPRLFFISACRGSMSDYGAEAVGPPIPATESRPVREYPVISLYKDALLAYAVPPGYQGYCNPGGPYEGSWFIQFLCKRLRENHKELDITSILAQTAGDVASHGAQISLNKIVYEFGQMPWYASMLTKQVYLSASGGKNSYW